MPYTPSYSTSLPSLPPTEESISAVVASLLDADRDPSPALSLIHKFVSGDFLIAPADHLKVHTELAVL